MLAAKLTGSATVLLQKDTLSIAQARETFDANEYYGILYLPKNTLSNADAAILYTEKQPNLSVVDYIESGLQKEIEGIKLTNAGINKSTLDSIKTNVSLQQKPVDTSGKEKSFSAGVTAGIGFGAGLLILSLMFIYLLQVYISRAS